MDSENKKYILAQLGTLLFLVVLFTLIGQGFSFLILKLVGIEYSADMMPNMDTSGERQWIRISAAIGHIISFTLSSVLFLYLYHKDTFPRLLRSHLVPKNSKLWLSFLLLIVAYPLVIKLSEWNLLLPLPEWAIKSGETSEKLIKGILQMDSKWELLMSIFLVGITPAIGEELLYRGIVQNKLIKYFGNADIAIFTASFLFSLHHLQFERILPFMMLGLVLGYSYHYIRSFWVPVILHFLNNSLHVIVYYGAQEKLAEMDISDPSQVSLIVVMLSIIATFGIIYYLKNKALEITYEQEPTT